MQSLLYGRAKRGATIKTHVRTQESFSTIHRNVVENMDDENY